MELNLIEILKDCPEGTRLYSPLFGYVELIEVYTYGSHFPIEVKITEKNGETHSRQFAANGKYWDCYDDDDVLLFPSKDCRDWSQFKAPKPEHQFKPFDKVLVCESDGYTTWTVDIFSHMETSRYDGGKVYNCVGGRWEFCIPYEGNEELLGTKYEPKED